MNNMQYKSDKIVLDIETDGADNILQIAYNIYDINNELIDSKDFYIYTTGIADWDNIDQTPTQWINYILHTVIRCIPPSFNKIIINHYDPLYNIGTNISIITTKKNVIIQKINNTVIANDIKASTSQITITSIFHNAILNDTSIHDPHILLDFSRAILKYDIRSKKLKMIDSKKEINGLYIGYVGAIDSDESTRFSKLYQIQNNFFTVSDAGIVTTYIDKLIRRNSTAIEFKNDDFEHNTAFNKIYDTIINLIIGKLPPPNTALRTEYIRRSDNFKYNHHEYTDTHFVKPLITDLMNHIMANDTITIDQIITTLVEKYKPIYIAVTNIS